MSTVTSFVGQIPELYDRHLGPVLFEPYARDLAARLPRDARRLLEIAAGTGRVTRHLLAALPADGELVATDLNEPMIAEGRLRLPNDPRFPPELPKYVGLGLGGLHNALASQITVARSRPSQNAVRAPASYKAHHNNVLDRSG